MKEESAKKLKKIIESSGIHKYYELNIEVDKIDTNELSVDLVSRKPLSEQVIREIETELNKMAKEIDKNILDVECSEYDFKDGELIGNNFSFCGENDSFSDKYELRFSMV